MLLEAGDIFCGECGAVVRSAMSGFTVKGDTAVIDAHPLLERGPPTVTPRPPTPAPGPESALDHGVADLEATRIVAPRSAGERFVLQFSTGETVTVTGSGLIGRNPVPEPGELVGQLVRVIDPTRSVSKTHLEFGQEAGSFWVRDRYSGNGTTLREPESPPRRCDPGKRYRLVRGSRLDLGEQFLVVS